MTRRLSRDHNYDTPTALQKVYIHRMANVSKSQTHKLHNNKPVEKKVHAIGNEWAVQAHHHSQHQGPDYKHSHDWLHHADKGKGNSDWLRVEDDNTFEALQDNSDSIRHYDDELNQVEYKHQSPFHDPREVQSVSLNITTHRKILVEKPSTKSKEYRNFSSLNLATRLESAEIATNTSPQVPKPTNLVLQTSNSQVSNPRGKTVQVKRPLNETSQAHNSTNVTPTKPETLNPSNPAIVVPYNFSSSFKKSQVPDLANRLLQGHSLANIRPLITDTVGTSSPVNSASVVSYPGSAESPKSSNGRNSSITAFVDLEEMASAGSTGNDTYKPNEQLSKVDQIFEKKSH